MKTAKEKISWNDVKEKYLKFHRMDKFAENMAIDIDFGYWLANDVINNESPIEKIKIEAYNEGFRAGRNYIKDSVNLTVSNDALAASFQTLRHYRETLIEWLEKL